MKIAVTAASGQLGGAIVNALVKEQGHENVVGLARTPANARSLGVEIRPGDYEAADQLRVSLKGVDALLLVSGLEAPEKRIPQHRNVINAARAAGVRKIVYTSIQGPDEGTAFSPVVQSNRQTEADIRDSGLDWVIGRNGIYIEPDVEYVESYKARGEIVNSAGDARCGYTTRAELARAYASLLTQTNLNGRTLNLHGEAITQAQLAEYLNRTFDARLVYREIPTAEFIADRSAELGPFFGEIIGGIYEGIRQGAFDNPSDFELVFGRPHQTWDDYFAGLRT
ncbi:SDR family oxidoreductase [Paracoccus sp. Z330]|uniref:SDR family oxidoreductase n=1 Tax=Paracoccus onchidii TaxID=3017813 RepID=A0ABT4ZH91_9RHOB|nr:SDR family oxidoreductase [Paracoccus onchidii]MDB6178724.1 SDR family oxidoreductase [Paracoccus onchidii]